MNRLNSSLTIYHLVSPLLVIFSLGLTACGGGDSDGINTIQRIPVMVDFSKSTAEFKQYEVIQLETNDACNAITKVSIHGNEDNIINTIEYGDNSVLLEIPQVIEPGQYTLNVDVFDTCTTDSNNSVIPFALDFVMQQGLTVANPEVYLETKANEVIALIDEMLLTATDQPLIDMLLENKALLLAEIDNISTQDSAITANNANLILNNDPLASLPVAGVLTTSRKIKIVASAALWAVAATTPGAQPAALIGLGLLTYNLLEFVDEYSQSVDSLYSDISFELDDSIEPIPTGVTITSGDITVTTDLIFAEGQTTTIRINETSRITTDDKNIIDEVKSAITGLISVMQNLEFLSSSITTTINTLSSANDVLVSDETKVMAVTDLTGYTVSTLTTDDIFAQITNTEAVLNGADTLDILASSYSGLAIFDGFEDIGANFKLKLSDENGNETIFSAVYQPLSPWGCMLSPLASGDNGQDYGGICSNNLHYFYDSESIYGPTDRYKVITCLEGCDNTPISFNEAKESQLISSISRDSSWAIASGWTKYNVEKWDLFDNNYQMNTFGLAAGDSHQIIWYDLGSTHETVRETTINGNIKVVFECIYFRNYFNYPDEDLFKKYTYLLDANGIQIEGSDETIYLESCPIALPLKPIPKPMLDI
ncbi:MAG: hypothetical protein DIZ80_08120 [endosymbiont of Galathealinum brachiosum]|uniref:Uncharacterized protein n=1 Tax=endosymbiont of Galathealinum brachiosum TaxID=2200906 RepID=A0A370DGP4_9GAMM|nr:MAG: hypothetical protein DIZ80_08120 [endosymbiont of Galathealinum brachiosum]